MKTRKLLSILITLSLVLTLFAFTPQTAYAAGHANNIIDVSLLDDTSIGSSVYSNWSYYGPTKRIAITGDVAVIGSKSDMTDGLTLSIGSGATVNWQASYSGARNGSDRLIDLSGNGTFVVEAGSSIINSGTGFTVYVGGNNINFSIGGGTVSTTDGTGIIGSSPITVSSGMVSATGGYAIVASANVNVSGGTVKATSGSAIYNNSSGPAVTVSGGTVSSITGNAIRIMGKVDISGGTVSATTGYAVYSNTLANVTINGGFVFAYGTAITGENNVVWPSYGGTPIVSAPGVLCAWNVTEAGTSPTYIVGEATNLITNPVGAAQWGRSGTDSGISYGTTGFLPVEGVTVNPIPPTEFTVSPTSKTLNIGDTTQLSVTFKPDNYIDKSVMWSSDDENVAIVSGEGLVTAKAAGTTTITVTTQHGNITASCQITVNPLVPTGVTVSPASKTLNIGDTVQLAATIVPENATEKSVEWSSDKTSIATVSGTGLVKAETVGTATITVKTKSGNKTATCQITVNPAKPSTVKVTKVSIGDAVSTMIIGNTRTLKAIVTPSNATNKAVTWSSSNAKVIKVDQSGKITAVGGGQATITTTAKDGSKKSASVTITVHQYVTMQIGKTTAIMNGAKTSIDSAGTKPFKISGKTMLPLRFVGEKMGGKVKYVNDKTPITMSYGDTKVEFKLGDKKMKVITGSSSKIITLDVAAQKLKGKTYIPLRAIGQALGFDVYYKQDGSAEYVVVNNPKMTAAVKNERLAEGKKVIK